MPPSGLKPLPYDRRDYDLIKTFGAPPPVFPEDYNTDLGLWTPDQTVGGEIFKLLSQPYGCTNFTQCDLAADDDGVLYDPGVLEEYTHANALVGLDMRVSLKQTTLKDRLKDVQKISGPQRTAYFAVKPTHPLDYFDAIRIAMLVTRQEGRAVSAGTPFYPEFGNPVAGSGGDIPHPGKDGILPMPADFRLARASWHNYKISGWKFINGVPYLICKMWMGPNYGDKGFVYMSRELCNALFNINGSAAFTLTKVKDFAPQRVDLEVVKWIVSLVRWVFGFDAPTVPQEPLNKTEVDHTRPAPESPALRLAEAARAMLGKDVTPDDKVPDEVACVASLVAIVPPEFGLEKRLTYTPRLLEALKNNPRFKPVPDPSVGTIVVSPTILDNIGHCGIYVEADQIASNNSRTGLWEKNYTRASWRSYFIAGKRLKGFLFAPVESPLA